MVHFHTTHPSGSIPPILLPPPRPPPCDGDRVRPEAPALRALRAGAPPGGGGVVGGFRPGLGILFLRVDVRRVWIGSQLGDICVFVRSEVMRFVEGPNFRELSH